MIRIGLIGAGKHGGRYLRHLREDFAGRLRLVAVCRRDRASGEELARRIGCRYVADFRELIASPDVEAVVAAVPPALHTQIVAAACEAGKPLLLEKPAACSAQEAAELLSAYRRRPVPLMVAQTLRYNAVVRTIREELERIGPVHALAFTQRFPGTLAWLDDPALARGGMIFHTGVHSFDLCRYLTGLEATEAVCVRSCVRTRRLEDNYVAAIRMGDGKVLASVAGSRATAGRPGYIEVAGEAGTLVGDHVLHRLERVVGTVATRIPLPPPVFTVRAVLGEFAAALERGGPVPIPLEEGLRAVAIAEACARAAETGAVARVEWPPG